MGHPRCFSDLRDESGLPPTPDVSLHCSEPTAWANSGLMHCSNSLPFEQCQGRNTSSCTKPLRGSSSDNLASVARSTSLSFNLPTWKKTLHKPKRQRRPRRSPYRRSSDASRRAVHCPRIWRASASFIPGLRVCPCCGDERLRKIGEDVTETLELIPRQWKVIAYVREKFSCRACEAITQAPAPRLRHPGLSLCGSGRSFRCKPPPPRS